MHNHALSKTCHVRVGGDPFVFGRGGEEAEALRAAGMDVAVVPGVSSAIAGPAAAGIPVTMRGHASGFTVVTGHEDPANSHHLDWDALAHLGTTLVVLMGASRAGTIAERLLAAGMNPKTPVAAVQSAVRDLESVHPDCRVLIAASAATALENKLLLEAIPTLTIVAPAHATYSTLTVSKAGETV